MADFGDALISAENQLKSGQTAAAERAFRELLLRSPGHSTILARLANVAASHRQNDQIVRWLHLAVIAAPSLPVWHHNLAVARQLLKSPHAALGFRRALLLVPAAARSLQALLPIVVDQRAALGEENAPHLTHKLAKLFAWSSILTPAITDHMKNRALMLLQAGEVFAAADVYRRYGRLAHGWPVNLPDPQPHPPQEARLQAVRQSNRHRLDHDGEQLAYIDRITPLPAALKSQVSAYREVSAGLSAAQQNAVVFDLDDDQYNRIAASYGRHTWRYETGWSPTRPALNPAVNWSQIAADFAQATPAHQVIDHFLSADALHALRRFCRESTIWHVTKGNGYLGAYFQDGFNDPVLAAIATQLRSSLPDLLGDYPVRMIWAYSYPQGGKGINPHADFARFNLNFWITEDDANLDAETGGLIIYRKAAPDHWDFKTYNTSSAQTIYDFLGADKQTFIRVPHRANRAVLFDSRLFHETDRFNFAPGFANRRINITMLFGKGP